MAAAHLRRDAADRRSLRRRVDRQNLRLTLDGARVCQRINHGNGPLWPEYTHMFVDEELQGVALKYNVLWQRPDLIHLHKHFMRESENLRSQAVARPVPTHLAEPNSPEHWKKYKALFAERQAAGFPGSEPL